MEEMFELETDEVNYTDLPDPDSRPGRTSDGHRHEVADEGASSIRHRSVWRGSTSS